MRGLLVFLLIVPAAAAQPRIEVAYDYSSGDVPHAASVRLGLDHQPAGAPAAVLVRMVGRYGVPHETRVIDMDAARTHRARTVAGGVLVGLGADLGPTLGYLGVGAGLERQYSWACSSQAFGTSSCSAPPALDWWSATVSGVVGLRLPMRSVIAPFAEFERTVYVSEAVTLASVVRLRAGVSVRLR